jgi:carboxyl-terminal processing protease
MARQRVRFLLTFLAGVVAAATVATFSESMSVRAAGRYDHLSLFTNVLDHVRRSYVEPIDEGALMKGAIRGLLQELDPHSSFLDPDAYREMQVETSGEFHGLGIEIMKHADGYIEVVSPIEGTPASKAGIRARDQIVGICPTEVPEDWDEGETCRSSKGMSLAEAVGLMRGRRNTEIAIEIWREGLEEPQTITIVRDVVKVVSVSGEMLEPGYAFVRLRAFQESTLDDLERTLEKLHDETPEGFKGLVLDMRDNPGGLLDQAVKVANKWVSNGLVVYTKGRVDDQVQEFRARETGTEPHYPVAILVNGGTASASEIVAGALQDQERALIIGQQTFGKGSVQTVYPLDGLAGLRLTTALYYTPAGRSIQEVGIAPDIRVEPLPMETLGSAEDRRERVREADLEGHFTHEEAEPDSELASSAKPKDVQLDRALEVLKSWTYFERLNEHREVGPVRASAPVESQPGSATP